jgi:membrane-associated two-gene conflict system component 1 (EACC1)
MEFLITFSASVSADEQRLLREIMRGDPELRGATRTYPSEVERGRLGSIVETLAVVLGPGGAATALASVLVSWLRRRSGDVVIKVTRPDGRVVVEVSAGNVRGLDLSGVRALVSDVSGALESQSGDEELS